jgi:hypothetical protein
MRAKINAQEKHSIINRCKVHATHDINHCLRFVMFYEFILSRCVV